MSDIGRGGSRRKFVQGIATGAMGAAAAGYMSGAGHAVSESRQTSNVEIDPWR